MLPSVSCLRLPLPVFACCVVTVLLAVPGACPAVADDAGASQPILVQPTSRRVTARTAHGPLTAMQLAARYALAYEDARTFVMLEGRRLRVRIYPNSPNVVVAGREYTVKDRIRRNGRDLLLTPRVATFLSRQIDGFFLAESRRQAVLRRARVSPAPLPPLPRRTPAIKPLRKPRPKPVVVVPKAAPKRPSVRPGDPAWVPPTRERKWKWIVIHHSDDESGSVAKYDRYHREGRGWEHGCGYHFVVGNGSQTRDGEVEWGPRWTQQLHGAHAKTPDNRFNDFGIGICLVGDFDRGGRRPTRNQMDSLVRLTRWLMNRYDIDVRKVRGHCDCCPTCCPGRNFPWAAFKRRLQ